jgi:hypothetical protein
MNPKLHVLAGLHAATWAQLGALGDDASYSDGPALLRRLRSIEDESLPLKVTGFADLQAKARIASTYADGGDEEMLGFIVAALVQGIETLARVAPVSEPFEFH